MFRWKLLAGLSKGSFSHFQGGCGVLTRFEVYWLGCLRGWAILRRLESFKHTSARRHARIHAMEAGSRSMGNLSMNWCTWVAPLCVRTSSSEVPRSILHGSAASPPDEGLGEAARREARERAAAALGREGVPGRLELLDRELPPAPAVIMPRTMDPSTTTKIEKSAIDGYVMPLQPLRAGARRGDAFPPPGATELH